MGFQPSTRRKKLPHPVRSISLDKNTVVWTQPVLRSKTRISDFPVHAALFMNRGIGPIQTRHPGWLHKLCWFSNPTKCCFPNGNSQNQHRKFHSTKERSETYLKMGVKSTIFLEFA